MKRETRDAETKTQISLILFINVFINIKKF